MSGSFELAAILVRRMMANFIDMNKAKFLVVGVGKYIDGEYQYETDVLDFIVELKKYNKPVHVFDNDADIEFLKEHYDIDCRNKMVNFGLVSTYSGIVFGVTENKYSYPNFILEEHIRGNSVILNFATPSELYLTHG